MSVFWVSISRKIPTWYKHLVILEVNYNREENNWCVFNALLLIRQDNKGEGRWRELRAVKAMTVEPTL